MEAYGTANPLPVIGLQNPAEDSRFIYSRSLPWILQLSELARSGILPVSLVVLSLLWIVCLAAYSSRKPLPRHTSRCFNYSSALLGYELCSQATRAAATICLAVCGVHHAVHWSIPTATAYGFVLGLVRLVSQGRWRYILLHQVNVVISLTFLSLLIGYWLPCVETSTQCNTRNLRAVGSWVLGLSAFVAFVTPREWVAPPLSDYALRQAAYSSLLSQGPAPEETCSWFSYYCTYQWFTPTISRGARNKLAKEDLPKLPWYDNPHILLSKLSKVRRAPKWGRTFWTTVRLMHVELATMTIWVCTSHTVELLSPLGLYQLLAYIDDPQEAVFRPWVWLAIVFVGPTANAVAFQQYVFISTRVLVRVKSALMQELYYMVLGSMEREPEDLNHTDGGDKKQPTTAAGRLANLIASDVDAIFNAREIMKIAIACPITVTIALAGLYQILGWPSLVGAAILILSSVAGIYTAQLMVPVQVKVREAQDTRVSLITEYLSLIRAVKYFAWEKYAIGKIQKARELEQRYLWRTTILNSMVNVISLTFPHLALIAMFGLRVFVQQKPMTSSVAFTTVFLVKTIRTKLTNMASSSKAITAAIVAFRRLDEHFDRSQRLQNYLPGPPRICDGTFGRGDSATFKLRDISIDFVEGGLNVVTGQSGSGKTTLLLSLLGETTKEAGDVTRPVEIAYAPQTAWLQNRTIRDNIVFPEVYEASRYQKIIYSCCLGPDLSQLPEGDETVIGENGASLSGGQRARVALARALYSKAPMVLLDDVFSALDAKTAAMVWERCFCGDLLQGRTVLLVTQVPWISAQADLEIELDDGVVERIEKHLGVVRTPVPIDAALATGEGLRGPNPDGSGDGAVTPDGAKARPIDLVDAEMETRKAGRMIAGRYLRYFGSPTFALLAVGFALLAFVCVTGASFWLALWTQAYDKKEAVHIGLYLGVYAGMVLGESILRNISLVMFNLGGWFAARTMHQRLVEAVMNVSLSWYTNTPVGRVVNRFSRDMSTLDGPLPSLLYAVVQMVVGMLFRLGSVNAILPVFFVPSAITCIVGFVVGEMYTRTGVILRRLVSSSQSPVLSQFTDTLAGVAVIRSRASVPEKFGDLFADRLTLWATAAEAQYNSSRWVGMRISFIASFVSLSAAAIALIKSDTIASGLVGFSLLHATNISTSILQVVRRVNDLEIELQSFDRVEEYLSLDHEEKSDDALPEAGDGSDDEDEAAAYRIPRDWPSKGQIEFRNVTVRYDPDGPDILSDINLTIRAGERVAVVGRTASGKSTLILSLLRFTHIASGTILYDGIDITRIPRKRLREALTIIPQEPVLFSGTVESNLDSTGSIPREALQNVIDATKDVASFQFRGENESSEDTARLIPLEEGGDGEGLTLSTPVMAKGENFSHGQRQVLSLCRALAQKNKVMLLDEATANMDYETDRAIQEVLGREVVESEEERTLVTVAHRLRTIVHYDTVVVMDRGKVLEVGNPQELYRARGDFYSMVKHSGEDDELRVL